MRNFLLLLLCLPLYVFGQAQIDLPITWDDTATVDYTVTDFGKNISMLAADPTNATNIVLMTEKPDSAELWAGTTLSTPAGLATAIPFTASNTVMMAVVYSPDAGVPVRLKVEVVGNPAISVETEDTTSVANAWDTLYFDFSNPVVGAPLDLNQSYGLASIFYNFGTTGAVAGSKTYYLDEVAFVPGANVYCNTQVYHLGNPAEVPSSIFLSIGNIDASSMFVEIESADGDPVDDLILPIGGVGISPIDTVAPGVFRRVISWTSTPPATFDINVLWSKASFGGNWQLSPMPVMVNFNEVCATGVTKAQIDLPINWDDTANIDFAVSDFGDNVSVLAADPLNASNIVLQTTKPITAPVWAGTTLSTPAGFASPIPFSAGNTMIKAVVYSPDAGVPVRLKVEVVGSPTISVETEDTTSVANAWDTLYFDFSNPVVGAPLDFNQSYGLASIFYNFGTDGATAGAKTYYLDEISFVAPPASTRYCNTQVYHLGNPAEVPSSILLSIGNIDASSMFVEIQSADADPVDDLILPIGGVGISPIDTVAPGILRRVISWTSTPPATFDINVLWSKVSFGGNWQLSPMPVTVAFNDTCTTALPPSKAPIDLPISWDDTANVDYTVSDFGNNVSVLAADPSNASNIVLETTKPASAPVWAGTTLSTPAGLATPIPFASGATTISARVYSPDAGTPVRLKVEVAGSPTIFVETEDTTTVANAWDTLVFDFANPIGPAIDFMQNYNLASIFYNFGTDGATAGAKTYYADDVIFGVFASSATKAQIDLPISWDDTANVDYTVADFGNNTSVLAADPLNAANIVLETTKPISAPVWAGTTLSTPAGLASPIPFSPGNTSISAVVYSPDAGTPVRLKVEVVGSPTIFVETEDTTTVANAWDTLVFDFANPIGPAIDFMQSYNLASIFYNFGTDGATAGAKTYYVDGVFFGGGGGSTPTKAQIDLPITWDDTANVDYSVSDFAGNASALDADPTNASNIVLRSEKTAGALVFAGTTLSTSNGLANPVPFAAGKTKMKVAVYSPDAGIPVRLKVEDKFQPTISSETEVLTTVANAWDTLTFDFSQPVTGAPVDVNQTYDLVTIFYNFGTDGATAGSKTYYCDLVDFDTTSAVGPIKDQIDLPITWDDTANVDYTVTDFGGNASLLDVDPLNPNNLVLRSLKTASALTFAGTTLGTGLGFDNPIPFSQGNTVIKVLVYSPDAGIPVRLKAENAFNGGIFVETEKLTTVANAWDTMYFDFIQPVPSTPAIDFNQVYDKLTIFYNFGVDGATAGAKTYYCDLVEFDSSGGAPPQVSNVTFQLDMSRYTGTFTTPEVNGIFNNFCGSCAPMADPDGNNIWEITIPITGDSTEFIFSVDNFTDQESIAPGSVCTKTTGSFTNRFLILTGDTVLPPYCWESCSDCNSTPATSNVTFRLDMTQYTGTFTTPEVNGLFNNFCGNCAPMADPDGDNIWEITIPVTADSTEFIFSVDNFADQETWAGGEPCTKTSGMFTNRFLELSGDTTLPDYCWESCEECIVNIDDAISAAAFNIYPNPSSGIIIVEGSFASEEVSIKITDSRGTTVMERSGYDLSTTQSFDMSEFENGVYFIQVNTSDEVSTQRLVLIK